ncbi:MAG: SDR family NAD(P)-dependent oxidoreductase [Nitrospirae bacterium]|nr:SDR family NAD(P)-dependent oxidoreductase [Nitrospirota bacterium]
MILNGKKVLVTGADGFIGSHLVEALIEKNCDVRAFVFYNSFNSWGWLDTFPKKTVLKDIDVFTGDVRDPNGVRKVLSDIDIVFHLAALIGIPFSYHSPDSYVDTNIKGTLNVLQGCRDNGIEKLIVTSTSEVYGSAQYVPINEKHPLHAQSPYAATKVGADSLAESFHLSFNLPVVIARPFNTYGPRQSARAVIPTTIIQLLAGKNTIKLGSLTPTRDFNFVKDICNGFIALAECDKCIGHTVNIGSGTETSVKELALTLIELINPDVSLITENERTRPVASEVERLLCDNSLIRKFTGWSPQTNLKDGLAQTIEWFKRKENLSGYKWDIYNV